MRGAAQYLVAHLIAKSVCQGQRDYQRRDTDRDADNGDYCRDARKPTASVGTQMTKGEKDFVRHERQNSGDRIQESEAGRLKYS